MLHIGFAFPHFAFQIDQLLLDAEKLFINGVFGIYCGILCQVAEGFVLGKGHKTLIGSHYTHDDTQESGLAGTVDADDGSFFVFFYVKGYISKDFFFYEGLGYVLAG